MPVGIDGQYNFAALQVPGLYLDIIPPSPFLVGAATNKVGLVGVGSWGPVDSIINISSPNDCAIKLGVSQIREYDIAWHIAAATQVGNAVDFCCVRVSDDTDVAATVGVQNVAATDTVTFTVNPTTTQTLSIGGTSVEFITSGATGLQVNLGVSLTATLTALLSFLQGSADTNLVKASYSLTADVLTITYKTPGTGGNTFAVSTTVSSATVATATLTGGGSPMSLTAKYTGTLGNGIKFSLATGTAPGTFMATVSFPGQVPEIFNNIGGTGNAFWVNLANAINNGTTSRGPSNYIVATAGALTVAPTLGVAVQLTGGTDGDSGVTDTSLVGVDTSPRTGMYALRRSGIDALDLCDLSTDTLWPAIDAFALAENCTACVSGASGDSYATVAAKRVSVGLDTFSTWIATGDFPSVYDATNGVTRLVNPAAAMVGFCGNASPEQSPLNKRLGGIVATESSQEGTTYSDADLTAINTSGIDVIIGPPLTPGGDYFSFATGRNASSNTAGNGVEYGRVTKFIARSLNTFAAGQIVGMQQSLRPDDPTRSRASDLLNSFFALLADPNSGSSGQGIIDEWQVTCDLTNNSPQSQAEGYLFAYCAVRYLNTVRYFVIRLAGGGNVLVSNSNVAPTGSSFSLAA